MTTYALQVLEAGLITTRPIAAVVYQAAVELQAKQEPTPAAAAAAPEAPKADLCVRALVDVPPFLDHRERTVTLRAGDLATVSPGIADLLVRRKKVVLVEASA